MLLFLLSYTVEVLHAKTTILFIEWASTFLLDKQITFVIINPSCYLVIFMWHLSSSVSMFVPY